MKCLGLLFLLVSTQVLGSVRDSTKSARASYITLSFGLSIFNGTFNAYKIGNVEEFYQHITGRDDVKLDDGAIGFKYVALGFRGTTNKLVLAVDLRIAATHQYQAIAGTNQGGTGFNASMNFNANMLEVAMLIGPNAGKGCVCLEASVISGFMGGEINIYSNPSQEYIQEGAFGAGASVGLHLDFPVGKSLLVNMKMGYRSLKISESHKDPATGELRTFYVNGQNGETVEVDWGGPYASAGLTLAFGLKGKR